MELVSYLISYNFVSVALIIGIIVLLIENRKERPRGTEHIAVIVLLLTIIVANTFFRELFLKESYDASYDYRGDPAMYFMYFRSTVEHILFPMIAYIEILLVTPNVKRYLLFIPEGILILAEIINLFGPKIIFSFDKHLDYENRILFLSPYFTGMIYMLLLLRYSIRFFKSKERTKGATVIFIVFLTIFECYLEAAYIVVDLMDEIVALDVIIFYFYLISIYQREMETKLRTSELELEKSRRVLTLSQIQPHFMYNSLTSIIYLCDKDTQKTKNALIDFSKYLRQNLDAMSRNGLVSIKEELEHTKIYLSLEKLRFDDDLNIEFDIRNEMFMLPVLTVQPMVENAVKHGINSSESGCGTVRIITDETETHHRITIMDDGAGFDTSALDNLDESHIGINNVRKRLEDECGGELIINSVPDEGTVCVILIPKEKNDENSGNR
ncbi:sensor histidine kinase [Ruminococcus flavefaciens]|uniref:sensor histidine kinase n=1 Tax=Ruminococcus flavefaciens TaxID=1265 RepID=UPI0004BBDB32|nr:histidine kinase [Ruminococcus flavefaciens]